MLEESEAVIDVSGGVDGGDLGMFGPARGVSRDQAWGAWAGCGHFEAVSRGCWFILWLFLVSAKLLQG